MTTAELLANTRVDTVLLSVFVSLCHVAHC